MRIQILCVCVCGLYLVLSVYDPSDRTNTNPFPLHSLTTQTRRYWQKVALVNNGQVVEFTKHHCQPDLKVRVCVCV